MKKKNIYHKFNAKPAKPVTATFWSRKRKALSNRQSLMSCGEALCVFAFLFLTPACSLFTEKKSTKSFSPRERVYRAPYDQVWRATQIALTQYPMRINNMDEGLLETNMVRPFKIWDPPYGRSKASGKKYHLVVRVIKGNSNRGQATLVSISKNIRQQIDFFSEAKPMPSDGFEEVSILYRIQREIKMDRAFQKAQKKFNTK